MSAQNPIAALVAGIIVEVVRDPAVKDAIREALAPAAPPPRLLSAAEIATATGRSVATIRRYARDGIITGIAGRYDLEQVRAQLAGLSRRDRAKAAAKDEESGVSISSIAAKNGLKLAGGSR